MRGSYRLTAQEVTLYTSIIQGTIEHLSAFQRERINLDKFDIAPCHVDDILHSLGWEREDSESNGWENDTWYYYSNETYNFGLIMFYCGYTFHLMLYRSDIDDE